MSKQNWKPGNMLYPSPVVMVSCKLPEKSDTEKKSDIDGNADRTGVANIITVAWTGTVCSDPAMLSISVRPERYSHDIIEASGEFVVNLVTEKLARAADWCGVKSGREYEKFKEMHLTEYVSDFMDTPAILESPVNIYCKTKEILRLGSHDMYVAEVTGVTVEDEYMNEKGRFCLEKTGLVAYSHGDYMSLGKIIGKFGYSVKRHNVRQSGKRSRTKSR